MSSISLLVKVTMVSASHGAEIAKVKNTAMIFGTKVSVISWIWVTDWNSEINTPTIRAAANMGKDRRRTMYKLWVPKCTTLSMSMPGLSKFKANRGCIWLRCPPCYLGHERPQDFSIQSIAGVGFFGHFLPPDFLAWS